MIQLNLPPFQYKIKKLNDKLYIFDYLRKKYIFLTPEEWVRQHFIHYLINEHHYPKTLIQIERGLLYNGLLKRTDIVVFDKSGNPFITIECKAADIILTQNTVDQAAQYNYILKAPYLLITNGLEIFCYKIFLQERRIEKLESLPIFEN